VVKPVNVSYAARAVLETILIGLVLFLAGIVYASFFEWTVHSKVMHRPILSISHFYRGHAQIHHGRYQGDSTFVAGDRPHTDITFAWWAMPFPILAHVPFLTPIALWVSMPAAIGIFVAFSVYQVSYEYFHYCMHVPAGRWFEQTRAFKWIDAHHFQHHRKHNTNLNVVLPIADFLLRTRVRPPQTALTGA
jgi:hypothetical protein